MKVIIIYGWIISKPLLCESLWDMNECYVLLDMGMQYKEVLNQYFPFNATYDV